jgi:hypothetical protein
VISGCLSIATRKRKKEMGGGEREKSEGVEILTVQL